MVQGGAPPLPTLLAWSLRLGTFATAAIFIFVAAERRPVMVISGGVIGGSFGTVTVAVGSIAPCLDAGSGKIKSPMARFWPPDKSSPSSSRIAGGAPASHDGL
jgi:hypothetical protein